MSEHGELRRWADEHQYDAEPQPNATEDGVRPSVHLISMTQDPLGVMAAFTGIYSGKVHRDLSLVTDDDRRKVLEDVQKTHLKAPLEVIKMHFLMEGVDRAFTHQHVRQRTAVYGQESMRFAVMGDLLDATTLPPSLAGTGATQNREFIPHVAMHDMMNSHDFIFATQAERNRAVWDYAIGNEDAAYHYLVEHGVPAEEARGLLPHATATRIHYITDLRNLPDHAGNRLCTQAQFHWREVFALMMKSIREYTPDFSWMGGEDSGFGTGQRTALIREWEDKFRWQYEAIADSGLFRPACYQLGYCPFEASFDRSCTIRERVQERAEHGARDSSQWDKVFMYWGSDSGKRNEVTARTVEPIRVEEWLLNPSAARKQS